MLRRLGYAFLAMVIVALLALNAMAWTGSLADEDTVDAPRTAPADPARRPPAEGPAEGRPIVRKQEPRPAPSKPRPAGMTMTLSATRGDCWVEVRAGSATGEVLFAGTLASGNSLRFERPKIWLRLGAASNVDVVVNGEPSTVPPGTVELLLPTA